MYIYVNNLLLNSFTFRGRVEHHGHAQPNSLINSKLGTFFVSMSGATEVEAHPQPTHPFHGPSPSH